MRDYIYYIVACNTIKKFFQNSHQHSRINGEIKTVIAEKKKAFSSNQITQLTQIKKQLNSKISYAKKTYRDYMLTQMTSNIKRAWQGLKNPKNQQL